MYLEPGNCSFVETLAATFDSGTYGDSVREIRPDAEHPTGYETPQNLFLIYIALANGTLDVRHMFDYRIGDIDVAEKDLFNLAQSSTPTPAYVGKNFQDLTWRFPCYFTIVLDINGWDFHWGPAAGDDPITFRQFKGAAGPFDPNHAFYNAERRIVAGRAAVRCINFLKADAAGTDMGALPPKKYSFDINVLTPFVSGGTPLKVIIDPDGQNQGPPSVP